MIVVETADPVAAMTSLMRCGTVSLGARLRDRLLQESGLDPKDEAVAVAASSFLSLAQVAALRELQQERTAGVLKPKVQKAVRDAAPNSLVR